jgi:putative transposase
VRDLGVARSSFYDARRQQGRQSPVGRPGPKPALSDAELLAAIRRDLARSPWTGEGHRKVWARLRVIDGIRVSRTVRRTTTTARSPPLRRT